MSSASVASLNWLLRFPRKSLIHFTVNRGFVDVRVVSELEEGDHKGFGIVGFRVDALRP